ncbi:MAG: hypothetical protein QG657_3881 [Acidobacteriota bacterium]|nr:hypothetical protein [Acidobacteriota bacterium]
MVEQKITTGLEIAVIGMSGRFPQAPSIQQFWDNLKNGVESIIFLTDDQVKELGGEDQLLENPNFVKTKGGFLENREYFDASFFGYTPKEAEIMDPQFRILHECAWEALEDAGYNPYTYEGAIGIYVGASSHFYWQALAVVTGKVYEIGEFAARQLTDRDFLSTRIAYKLNLKGPAVLVQTACSTSLTVIHMACRALITGECDIALAGGVSVPGEDAYGYLYREGMIFSPDGHCRAFDADAKGTTGGNGSGIVVLKRLKYAHTDKDHIYAVVLGSAVNNDGTRKVGYTAPSIEGQVSVIRAVHRVTRIEPESIGYIETHGTGTILGDPIEIEALKQAFNSPLKKYCAIGSVKTNIGHLDAAAGIAGFIKTVLALKHKQIPPSLHFRSPNPKIDFENSPFYVNIKLQEWKNDRYPLRAGVSSFGIGGTNVHILLEEAPPVDQAPGNEISKNWKLTLLSAKTETALNNAAKNLADNLKKNSYLNLEDVAYTLQVGRAAFQHRGFLVCSELEQVIGGLSSPPHSGKFHSFDTKNESPFVVFMFPGQGAQYVDMGLELYRNEPVFREAMDQCFKIFESTQGYDIKDVLYPGEGSSGSFGQEETARHHIDQTSVAQPVLFIFEYALAKLLMKWGIKPDAMIGYSLGEYTAACLSGVFSLEDALKIILIRGRLLAEVPGGAMLSIPLSSEEIAPLLPRKLSLAIDNGSTCIVAGPAAEITFFEQEMKQKKLLCMPVSHSVAMHSQMMEPILSKFKKELEKITFNIPKIPYISNLTGTWITSQDVGNPGYLCNHLGKTVRFADGFKELAKKRHAIFIEVGPGRDLSIMTKRFVDDKLMQYAVNLVRPPQQKISDAYYLLKKIGYLWLYGLTIDWDGFYDRGKPHRVSLPSYPYDRRKYWIKGDPFKISAGMVANTSRSVKEDIADWFYVPVWQQCVPGDNEFTRIVPPLKWLLFINEEGLGPKIAEFLLQKNQIVTTVKSGTQFIKEIDSTYTIDPGQNAHYDNIFRDLKNTGRIPGKILHLWSVTPGNSDPVNLENIYRSQDLGLYSLMYIAQTIGYHAIATEIQIVIITNHMQSVTGEEAICPEKGTIIGAVKIIPLEYANISCRSIDIVIPEPGSHLENHLIKHLVGECISEMPDHLDNVIAYRGLHRWIPIMKPHRLTKMAKTFNRLKEKGVYLITGGMGGMGLTLAGYLAARYKARLVLVGRSVFPAREEWDEILSRRDQKEQIRNKIQKIREFEELGAEVMIFSADVSDFIQMNEVISRAKEQFGSITGVLHTAGIIDYKGVIQRRTREMNEEAMAPKVKGTLVLERLLEHEPLDFFVLFSSLGNQLYAFKFGQVGYNAANEFLDAYALYKQKKHNVSAAQNSTFYTAINWCDWLDVGMTVESFTKKYGGNIDKAELNSKLYGALSPEQGVDVFARIMENQLHRVAISMLDLNELMEEGNVVRMYRDQEYLDSESKENESRGTAYPRPELSVPYVAPSDNIQQCLTEIFKQFFGFEEVGIEDDFFELGGDSLKATTVALKIQKELKVKVTITELFRTPTIKALADFIRQEKEFKYSSIEPIEKKEYYPLSSAQKRLYILYRMNEQGKEYNIPFVSSLAGEIIKDRLVAVFQELINRHESFRTSFHIIDNQPAQRIHENVEFDIQYFDSTTGIMLDIMGIIDHFIRPFDLSKAPLLRIGLIKESQGQNILMADMHHIVSDGMSMNILLRDFIALNEGRDLPALRFQYKDFSDWQNRDREEGALKDQEVFWLNEFAGEIPVLQLPYDFARPSVQGYEGNNISFEIDNETAQKLKDLALKDGITLYMVLLSAFTIFLSKLGNQEDIVVGSPLAGRSHAGLENIIGMFVNTLAFRNYPAGEKTFKEFLREVKEKTLRAFENQEYQYDNLVEKVVFNRDVSRNPLFDSMLVLQNLDAAGNENQGMKLSPYQFENKIAKFDLTLIGAELENNLLFVMEYSTQLFRKSTIERFSEYFKKIISGFLGDRERDLLLSEIEMLPDEEKKRILLFFNDTEADYPSDKTIHLLFEEQVVRVPDRIALVAEASHGCPTSGQHQVTYHELNANANRLAHELNEEGFWSNTIVGISIERTVSMIVGILGILKSGGVYLPIDPELPQDRIDFMLKDSGANLLVTSKDKEGEKILLEEIPKSSYPLTFLPSYLLNSSNLAYIIYTSGSTGRPKGVLIEHRSVVNRLHWMQENYPISGKDVLIQKTSFMFDVSVWEIFWWSFEGASLYLLESGGEKNPQRIIGAVERFGVTVMHFVPPMLSAFLDYVETNSVSSKLSGLKKVFASGEALNSRQVEDFNRVLNQSNGTGLINLYGPTEATVDVSYFNCPARDVPVNIPIGKPIDNIQLYIINRFLQLQPIGIPGELCISGIGLARGYLNSPELTAERFIRPYRSNRTYIFHKTGDLARWLPDGNIEYLGRIDRQIKIRGFRIELGEIECRLLSHKDIMEAIVLYREDRGKEKYLCAYLIAVEKIPLPELRAFLAQYLPDYMIPLHFVQLEKMPLTPNGKIDRKALPVPETGDIFSGEYMAPRDEIEEKLTRIWMDILGLEKEKISVRHNFFQLGGYSIGLIKLLSMIFNEFGIEMPITHIYQNPTIQEIAICIKSKKYIDEPMVFFNGDNQKKLFTFPPASAFGLAYQRLANVINDYSFCSFNFIENENRLINYMNIMLNQQPTGPYIFLGWSAAGKLIFDVTRVLEECGREVSDIILIDSFLFESLDLDDVKQNFMMEIVEFLGKIGMEYLKEKVLKKIDSYFSYTKNKKVIECINANVHLLSSEEARESEFISFHCWDEFTSKPVLIYNGLGKHNEMFNPDHIVENAQVVRKILNQIESKNRKEA